MQKGARCAAQCARFAQCAARCARHAAHRVPASPAVRLAVARACLRQARGDPARRRRSATAPSPRPNHGSSTGALKARLTTATSPYSLGCVPAIERAAFSQPCTSGGPFPLGESPLAFLFRLSPSWFMQGRLCVSLHLPFIRQIFSDSEFQTLLGLNSVCDTFHSAQHLQLCAVYPGDAQTRRFLLPL